MNSTSKSNPNDPPAQIFPSISYKNNGLTNLSVIKLSPACVIFSQENLDLSCNCLTSDLSPLAFLLSLRILNLSSNHISTIPSLPSTLEHLNLSCNHISAFSSFMPELISLDLSCNLIHDFTQFSQLSGLKSLYVGYNLIKEITGIEEMNSLVELDLEHNMIRKVTELRKLMNFKVPVFVVKKNPAEM
jgi:internalin A